MNVTIHDIAKVAKVSASTVSRVLNDSPSISEKTKIRIREIMKELNYTPNLLAKQLATQSSMTIALLIDTSHPDFFLDPFFFDIIQGCQSILLEKNYDVSLCDIAYLEPKESFLKRFVFNKKADGIIMHNTVATKSVLKQLNELDFPYVVLGKPDGNLKSSWVEIDNTLGGEFAAKHLIEQGYSKIAFIAGTKTEPISNSRIKGFYDYSQKHGFVTDSAYIKYSIGDKASGFNNMAELLSMDTPPDSVICVNNFTAFGALEACHQNGIRVPEEIGIVTFDDFPLAPYTTPSLTSLAISTFEQGKMASEILIDKLATRTLSVQTKIILPQLIVRVSSVKKK